MKKLPFVLSVILLVTLWAVFGSIAYLKYYPVKIIKFDSPYIEIGKTIVKHGERQPVRYPFEKYVDIIPEIHTRLINQETKVEYPLGIRHGNTGSGRHENWFFTLEIPDHVPPGKYIIIRTFVFQVNFLREEKISIKSPEFEIIPNGSIKSMLEKLMLMEKRMEKMRKP
jgi:hypothetical protein